MPIADKSSHKITPPEGLTHSGTESTRSMIIPDNETDERDESSVGTASSSTVIQRASTKMKLLAAPTFDVWSLGIILFELATRQPIISGNADDSLQQPQLRQLLYWSRGDLSSALDVLRAGLRGRSDVKPDDVLAIVDCVAWCLQPEAGDRPPSMNELLNHKLFSKEGGNLRMSARHAAAALGDVESVKQSSVPVDDQDPLLLKTPLHVAAEFLQAEVITVLVAQLDEQQLNMRNANGETPLHALLRSASEDLSCPEDTIQRAFEALGSKADLTLPDRHGRVPIEIAYHSPNPHVLKFFSRLHIARQLSLERSSAERGIKTGVVKGDKGPPRRRLSLSMIEAGEIISPEFDGVQVIVFIVGNCGYKVGPLRNPANDAMLMKHVLTSIPNVHKVIVVLDGTKKHMDDGAEEFESHLGPGCVGIFFYAGHGLQVKGVNYLVPVDYENPNNSTQLLVSSTVPLQSILEMMERKNTLLNLCIIDACRDNPFPSDSRTLSAGGLAQTKAPAGSMLAYATAPGDTASDGSGANGLYTEHLAAELLGKETILEVMFKRVRVGVRKATKDAQTPWEESSLIVNFALFTAANPAPSLDKVKKAAVAELAELGKASQCEQELQDQIVEFEKQMDDVDDDGSDVNDKRLGQLRRQIKKLKAELAELKKLPSSSRGITGSPPVLDEQSSGAVFSRIVQETGTTGFAVAWDDFERAFASVYLGAASSSPVAEVIARLRADMDTNDDGFINRAEWAHWHQRWVVAGAPPMVTYLTHK